MHRLLATTLALSAAVATLGVPTAAGASTGSVAGFTHMEPLHDGAVAVEAGLVRAGGSRPIPHAVAVVRRGNDGWRLTTYGDHGTTSPRSTSPSKPVDLALGDLDGDGDLDALVALSGSDRHAVHRNDGSGAFGAGEVSPRAEGEPDAGGVLRLADMDGDGDTDAVRLDPVSGTLRLLRNDGTGAFATATTVTTVPGGRTLAVGDLTGDGRADAAVGAATTVVVVRNDGTGGVAGETSFPAGADPDPLVADVTGDGANDLVAGTATAVVAYPGAAAGTPVTLLGFGATDLALTSGRLSGLTEHGPFVASDIFGTWVARHAAQPGLTDLAAADMSGDGSPEVVGSNDTVATFWYGGLDLGATVPDFAFTVGTGQTVRLLSHALNFPVPVDVTWYVSRGTVDGDLYTAPATGGGNVVRVQGTLPGTADTIDGTLAVLNTRYERIGLAGREVRGFAASRDPAQPWYVTDDGIHRAVPGSSPTRHARTGSATITGADARELAVVAGEGGRDVLVARFGPALFRYDTGAGDWTATGPSGVTSLAAAADSEHLYAAAGGQVWRSTDDALTWTALGGSEVASVHVDRWRDGVWAVTSGGALLRAPLQGDFVLAPVTLPYPDAKAERLHAHVDGTAVTLAGDDGVFVVHAGHRVPMPAGATTVTDSRYAYSYTEALLALRPGTRQVYERSGGFVDADGRIDSWIPVGESLAPGTVALSVWWGSGAPFVGTDDGAYRAVDETPPGEATISPGAWFREPASLAAGPFTFTLGTSGEPAASFACALDRVWTTCGPELTVPGPLADGRHTLVVVAIDADSNESRAATFEFAVDGTAPAVPVISTAPPARTRGRSASFAFTAPDAARTTCSLDGAAPSDCASGVAYESLGDGAHAFAVRAVDEAGNASAPAPHAWTVDATPPAVPVLTAAPPAQSATASATFTWTGDDDVDYECSLSGGAFGPCASGVSYSSLAEGPHAFSLVASDSFGNPSRPVVHEWTVDLTPPPGPVLTSAPPAVNGSADVSVSWTGTAHRWACVLDGASGPCTSPFTATVGDGPHVLDVVAYDAAGNAATTTHAWRTDLRGPAVTIAAPPSSLLPTVTVTLDEPGTAALTLKTGTVTVPSTTARKSPTSVTLTPVTPLVPGQVYVVAATGTDTVGNAGAPVTRTFRAPVSEQENGLAATASWKRVPWSGAQGGSFHVAHVRGASASYVFTGTSVTWYGVRGPTYGLADVYVDNVLKASKVNLYSTTTGALTRTIGGLTNAKHTLRIVVRGERGSTSGRGTDVAVDAFKVGTALAATPGVTWAWARTGSAYASGGGYAVEDTAGATYTLRFRGRGIDWVTVLGPNMGKATVRIDGVSKGTFDNWASAARYGAVRSFTGLTDTVHTMTVTVLGTRRTGATGSYVAVDRFGIRV